MQSISGNNQTILKGKLQGDKIEIVEPYGNFIQTTLAVSRLSGEVDLIPVNFKEEMIKNKSEGDEIAILGQFRSKNIARIDGGRNKLELMVYALSELETDSVSSTDSNIIMLSGFICKPPVYRVTPFGREITDILVAVNRGHKKSDYLPCIAWSTNAQIASKFVVGDAINIIGRVQSRAYTKKLDGGETIKRTAYEVSIIKLLPSGAESEARIKVPFSHILENVIVKNSTFSMQCNRLSEDMV